MHDANKFEKSGREFIMSIELEATNFVGSNPNHPDNLFVLSVNPFC